MYSAIGANLKMVAFVAWGRRASTLDECERLVREAGYKMVKTQSLRELAVGWTEVESNEVAVVVAHQSSFYDDPKDSAEYQRFLGAYAELRRERPLGLIMVTPSPVEPLAGVGYGNLVTAYLSERDLPVKLMEYLPRVLSDMDRERKA